MTSEDRRVMIVGFAPLPIAFIIVYILCRIFGG